MPSSFIRQIGGEVIHDGDVNELQIAIERDTAGIFNVLEYDAVGSGETDDTSAIQAAFADGIAAGQIVLIPPGTYNVTNLTIDEPLQVLAYGAVFQHTGTGNLLEIGREQVEPFLPDVHWYGGTFRASATPSETAALMALERTIRAHVRDVVLDGNGTAQYGMLLDDQAVRNTIENVHIFDCQGTPGIGLANVDRAYSSLIHRAIIEDCNVGMRWLSRCQDSKVVGSQISGNRQLQVQTGDGVNPISLLTFETSQIERLGQPSDQPVVNLRVNGVSQLVLRSCYLETNTIDESWPIEFPTSDLSSAVHLDGCLFQGNSIVTSAIVLPDDTQTIIVSMEQCRILNFLGGDPIANRTAQNKHVFEIPSRFGGIAYNINVPAHPLDIEGSARIAGILNLNPGPGGIGFQVTRTDETNGRARLTANGNFQYRDPASDTNSYFDAMVPLSMNVMATGASVLFRIQGGIVLGSAGTAITAHHSGIATWDPGSVADGATETHSVMVTGAAVGDTVSVGFSQPVPVGALLVGAVTAVDTVGVTLLNLTGAPLDLATGTLRADVWQH